MPAYDPTFGDGGTLFIGANSKIYAVDPATGKDRWTPVSVGAMHGNMAIASGLIFANTGSDGLQILDEATGKNLRTLSPPNAGAGYGPPPGGSGRRSRSMGPPQQVGHPCSRCRWSSERVDGRSRPHRWQR